MIDLRFYMIMERVKRIRELPFDVEDIDEDFGRVLVWCGIIDDLKEEEKDILRRILRVIAVEQELAEVTRLLHLQLKFYEDAGPEFTG